MTLKEKIKSYSFWVSLTSALVLILKVIGSKFGFNIDATLASDIITSLCSILVITGIIVTPTSKSVKDLEFINNSNKPQETTEIKTTFKDNISILSETLKETAGKILDSTETIENKKIEETTEEKTYSLSTESKTENCQDKQNVVIESQNTIMTKPVENVSVEEIVINPIIEHNTESIEVVAIENFQTGFEPQTNMTNDDDFKKMLASQKDKYIKNLDAYIEILSQELNSLKSKE